MIPRWRGLVRSIPKVNSVNSHNIRRFAVDPNHEVHSIDRHASKNTTKSAAFAALQGKLEDAYKQMSSMSVSAIPSSTNNASDVAPSSGFPSFTSLYQLLKSDKDVYYHSSSETLTESFPGTYAPHVTSLERIFGVVEPSTSSSSPVVVSRMWLARRALLSLLHPLFTPFLPAHFPDHFGDNAKPYLSYAYNSFVASIFGAAASIVSMQALLVAMGMTAIHAAPAAAALTWIVKDLVGQVGGALLASQTAHHFDAQPRLHRLKATRLFLYAAALELLTPLFPALFVPIGAIANMMKNVSWLVTAATRASAHLTFASVANLGDVTGKSGAQATAAGVIGTSLGAWISYLLARNDTADKHGADNDDDEAVFSTSAAETSATQTSATQTSATQVPATQGGAPEASLDGLADVADVLASTSIAHTIISAPGVKVHDVLLSWTAFAALGVTSYLFTRRAVAAVTTRTLDRYRTDIILTHCATAASKLTPPAASARVTSSSFPTPVPVPVPALAPVPVPVLADCTPFAVAREESMETPYLPRGWKRVALDMNDARVRMGKPKSEDTSPRSAWSRFRDASASLRERWQQRQGMNAAQLARGVPVWAEALGSDADTAWWTLDYFQKERYILCISPVDSTIVNSERVSVTGARGNATGYTIRERMAEYVWSHMGWGNAKSCTIDRTAARPVTRRALTWTEATQQLFSSYSRNSRHNSQNESPTPPPEDVGTVYEQMRVRVWLKEGSDHYDQLCGYTHAWVARHLTLARTMSTAILSGNRENTAETRKNLFGKSDDVSEAGETAVLSLFKRECANDISTLSDRDIVMVSKTICEKYLWNILKVQVETHKWNLTTLYLADIDGFVDFPISRTDNGTDAGVTEEVNEGMREKDTYLEENKAI